MAVTKQNAHVVPMQNYETHRTRIVCGWYWSMQVLYIRGEGYQATYFEGADPKIWSECYESPEQAAYELDRMVSKLFNIKELHVKVSDRIPVPISNPADAVAFAKKFDGLIL